MHAGDAGRLVREPGGERFAHHRVQAENARLGNPLQETQVVERPQDILFCVGRLHAPQACEDRCGNCEVLREHGQLGGFAGEPGARLLGGVEPRVDRQGERRVPFLCARTVEREHPFPIEERADDADAFGDRSRGVV